MTVVISIDGPVAVITLSRPEVRNALSAEMCREITTIRLERLAAGEASVSGMPPCDFGFAQSPAQDRIVPVKGTGEIDDALV